MSLSHPISPARELQSARGQDIRPDYLAPMQRTLSQIAVHPAFEMTITSLTLLRAEVIAAPAQAQTLALIQRVGLALADGHTSENDLARIIRQGTINSNEKPLPRLAPCVAQARLLERLTVDSPQNWPNRIDITMLQDFHRTLMAGMATVGVPGQLRSRLLDGKSTSSTPSKGPDSEKSPESLITDLLSFINQPSTMPIVMRVCLTWGQVLYIQPFDSGNTRLGESLVQAMLANAGFPAIPIIYMADARARCLAAAGRYLRSPAQIDAWLEFSFGLITRACSRALRILQQISKLRDGWRERAKGLRSDAATWQVLPVLEQLPVVAVSDLQKRLGLSFQTANNALHKLQDLGIVSAIDLCSSQGGRLFVANEILAAISANTKDRGS